MMRRALLGLVVALAAATARGGDIPDGILDVQPRPAPSLALTYMDGSRYALPERPGHWVMVHFWASWCSPCREEVPTIARMTKRLSETSLEVVLVNTAETEDEVFTFLAAVAPDLETLMDRDGSVTDRWQPRGLPASFLVDPGGRIQYVALGGRDWDSPAYLRFLRSLVGASSAADS